MKTKKVYYAAKRVFDFVCALIGIIVTSPLWLFAAVGIEISDPGPVFYMAKRVGKNNEVFDMFKFRSMRVDKGADEKGFKADKKRIFVFGELIRRLKIDELPQLINILKGDMSIVGPRPASVDQVEIVRAGQYAKASTVNCGLTGPSALYDYIYGDTIEDEAEYEENVLPTRLALDICYVTKASFLYDIKMVFYTIECILCSLLHKKPKKIFNELLSSVDSTEL